LQAAGLVAKAKRRGAHRKKRVRRPQNRLPQELRLAGIKTVAYCVTASAKGPWRLPCGCDIWTGRRFFRKLAFRKGQETKSSGRLRGV